MKKIILAAALAGFASSPVFADHMTFRGIDLTGSPTGGFHTIDIDGAKCKLKSSALVGAGASAGCNYIITIPGIEAGGVGPITVKPEQANGCSTKCE